MRAVYYAIAVLGGVFFVIGLPLLIYAGIKYFPDMYRDMWGDLKAQRAKRK